MIDFRLLNKLNKLKDKYNLNLSNLDRIKNFQNKSFTISELEEIVNIDKQKAMQVVVKLKENNYLETFMNNDVLSINLTEKAKNLINEVMNNKKRLLNLTSEENNLVNKLIEILDK